VAGRSGKKIAIIAALVGIAIELVSVVLLSSHRITPAVATPLIIVGMFLAFVPLFVVSRNARGR
jgi:hypothetical protein